MSSLAAATRATRRDALKHPLQSLAAILLVALPVAFFTGAFMESTSTMAASSFDTTRTTANYGGGTCEQTVDGYSGKCSGTTDSTDGRSEQQIINEALPDGFTASLQYETSHIITHGADSDWLNIKQVNPSLEEAPAPGEIFLPRHPMERLGVEPGDTLNIQTNQGDVEVTVRGTVPSYAAIVSEPTLVNPATFSSGGDMIVGQWGITGPRAFTWEDVETLNAAGFMVQSQDLIDNPPPPGSGMDPAEGITDLTDQSTMVIGMILYIIGAIIVAFLVLAIISPVFTISVGRQSRNFALMASQGATPRHIRWAVLVYGTFAGLVGASLGAVVGWVGLSAWWTSRFPDWPLTTPWWELLALWVFAVLAATVAAFLPAVIASRASIIAGIHGASPDRLMRWRRWMLIGPVLLAVTLVLFIIAQLIPTPVRYGYSLGIRDLLVGLGSLSGAVGVALTAPAMVWLLGKLTKPLPLRLAGRDLLRQSLRAVPALAAIAAFTAVASMVMVSLGANENAQESRVSEAYETGAIFISGSEGLDQAAAAVNRFVGPTEHSEVYGVPSGPDPWSYTYLTDSADAPVYPECDWTDPDDENCYYQGGTYYVAEPAIQMGAAVAIATPELLEVLKLPGEAPDGAAMLVAEDVTATEATFEIGGYEGDEEVDLGEPATLDLAPVLPSSFTGWLPTPEAFDEFGVESERIGAVMLADRNLTASELESINEELEESGSYVTSPFRAEAFWDSENQARAILTAIVVVIAALVMILSMGHTRRQNSLLEAVGAAPGLTRTSNALFGALVTLAGSALGLVAGHLGALLTATREQRTSAGWLVDEGTMQYIGIDWWLALGLLVIAPILAAVIGWIFTPKADLTQYRE